MRRSRSTLVMILLIGALTACSGGGARPSGSTPPAASSAPTDGSGPASTSGPAGTSAPAVATRFTVKLTDTLRMEPAQFTVPRGVPVTFVVTNSGAIDHEFYLGDEQEQAEHETEMAAGGMVHDVPNGITVKPAETKELTFTFTEAGGTLAGCHVPGHYPAGMKATITVQ